MWLLNADILAGNAARQWLLIAASTPESGDIALLTFKKGATGAEVLYHNSIIGNFMVYQIELKHIFYLYIFKFLGLTSLFEQ